MTPGTDFAIIGGGMLGLTTALRLAQRGAQVTVYEAAPELGGLAAPWQLDDLIWDRHYHVTLLSDESLRGLLRELDLDRAMRWVTTRTGFFADGKLHGFTGLWDFIRFPLLNPWQKFCLLRTIQSAARRTDYETLEKIPVADWLTQQSGAAVFEKFWRPLLRAKLGDAYLRTSAAFIWATIQRLYAARRSGLKRELFGYLPGGYACLLDALAARLHELGVTIRTSSPVRAIRRQEQRQLVELSGGEVIAHDRAVVTLPTDVAAEICCDLGEQQRSQYRAVEYLGILCASVLTRQPLIGSYITNITDPAPFTGLIDMTGLVDPTEFGGRGLLYLPRYATADDPAWDWSDAELERVFLDRLRQIVPFEAADVRAFRVSRVRRVFALSTLEYSRRVPPMNTGVPGLYLVTSAQIVNGTLNVNETVRLAEAALPILTDASAL